MKPAFRRTLARLETKREDEGAGGPRPPETLPRGRGLVEELLELLEVPDASAQHTGGVQDFELDPPTTGRTDTQPHSPLDAERLGVHARRVSKEITHHPERDLHHVAGGVHVEQPRDVERQAGISGLHPVQRKRVLRSLSRGCGMRADARTAGKLEVVSPLGPVRPVQTELNEPSAVDGRAPRTKRRPHHRSPDDTLVVQLRDLRLRRRREHLTTSLLAVFPRVLTVSVDVSVVEVRAAVLVEVVQVRFGTVRNGLRLGNRRHRADRVRNSIVHVVTGEHLLALRHAPDTNRLATAAALVDRHRGRAERVVEPAIPSGRGHGLRPRGVQIVLPLDPGRDVVSGAENGGNGPRRALEGPRCGNLADHAGPSELIRVHGSHPVVPRLHRTGVDRNLNRTTAPRRGGRQATRVHLDRRVVERIPLTNRGWRGVIVVRIAFPRFRFRIGLIREEVVEPSRDVDRLHLAAFTAESEGDAEGPLLALAQPMLLDEERDDLTRRCHPNGVHPDRLVELEQPGSGIGRVVALHRLTDLVDRHGGTDPAIAPEALHEEVQVPLPRLELELLRERAGDRQAEGEGEGEENGQDHEQGLVGHAFFLLPPKGHLQPLSRPHARHSEECDAGITFRIISVTATATTTIVAVCSLIVDSIDKLRRSNNPEGHQNAHHNTTAYADVLV